MPTLSALGIPLSGRDALNNRNYTVEDNPEDLLHLSPFDAVYYDKDYQDVNSQHIFSLNEKIDGTPRFENEILDIIAHEIMNDSIRISNKKFENTSHHKAPVSILLSGNSKFYNQGIPWNSDDTGDVSFSSQSETRLIAGDEIIFNDGVEIAYGAHFCAEIDESLEAGDCNTNSSSMRLGKEEEEDNSTFEFGTDENGFNIFPNPNSGNFTITWDSDIRVDRILIRDLSGKIIWRKEVNNNNTEQVTLPNGHSGVYFVEMISATDREVKRVLIK